MVSVVLYTTKCEIDSKDQQDLKSEGAKCDDINTCTLPKINEIS